MNPETHLTKHILIALSASGKGRFWRQNTGVARALSSDHVVRYSIPGAADLTGIIKGGRRFELEIKTARGVQSKQQKQFQAMIERWGGYYGIARSVQEGKMHLERALR